MRGGRTVRIALLIALAATPAVAAVGVTTRTFAKTSVTNGAPRPLETVIWYPAGHGGVPEPFGRRDARVRRGRFPLIVFSHGACGLPTEASYLTMALARAGFVVAAPPHHPNTRAEGSSCGTQEAFAEAGANRVPDVRFVIDAMLAESATPGSRFARRLRPDGIGLSGLSFGGFTTLLAIGQEPRVTAALAMVPGGSAFVPRGITIPTMVIGAEHDRVVGFMDSLTAYGLLTGPRFLIELLGGDHLSVVDECVTSGINLCGELALDDGHRLVLRYAVPFFRRYLGSGHGKVGRLRRAVDGAQVTAEP